jgi:hypothetical protein
MKVALDVESVLADSNEAALQSTDKLDRAELLGEWDLSEHQWQVYMGVTDAIWRHNPQFIPPEEPNLDRYVAEIRESVETLDILTAREHVDESIVWWLSEHGIEYDEFISTGRPKYEYDYDVFIDDNPEMVGSVRLFLRDQPWNQSVDDEALKTCDRICSLGEVSSFL